MTDEATKPETTTCRYGRSAAAGEKATHDGWYVQCVLTRGHEGAHQKADGTTIEGGTDPDAR